MNKIIILFFPVIFSNSLYSESFFNPGGSLVEEGVESFEDNRFSDSLENFQKAEKYLKDDPRLSFNRGSTLLKGGQIQDSIGEFQKALEKSKKEDKVLRSRSFFNLGKAYSQIGDKKKAHAAYKKALQEDPNLSDARKNLELLYKNSNSSGPQKNSSPNNSPSSGSQNNQSDQSSSDTHQDSSSNPSDSNSSPSKGEDSSEQNAPQNSENSPGEDSSNRWEGTLTPEDAESIMESMNPDQIRRRKGKSFLQRQRDKFW